MRRQSRVRHARLMRTFMTSVSHDSSLRGGVIEVRHVTAEVRNVTVERGTEPEDKHYGDQRKSADRSIEQAQGVARPHVSTPVFTNGGYR